MTKLNVLSANLCSSQCLLWRGNSNLNIPRYVDTFEEGEPVDLEAVAADQKALDEELASTNETIAAFCQELNISTPF